MTVQEMKKRKKEMGLSNEQVAKMTGVPLGTVQKVFGGSTATPRYDTLSKLEKAFTAPVESPGYTYTAKSSGMAGLLKDPGSAYGTPVSDREYTIEDIYALPDGVRAELMDGKLYYMALPTRTHQRVIGETYLATANHIRSKGGSCEVYIPPFAVFPFADDSTYLEPDMVVICDTSILEERGCVGAPDWVVEVVSPSSSRLDYGKKLTKYRESGVREYWIIYPAKRVVTVYLFENRDAKSVTIYSFDDSIPSETISGLTIRLSDHV